MHEGSVPLDEIIRIARVMRERSMARTLEGTIKEILGTAQSTGCKVNGQHPTVVIEAIEDGTFILFCLSPELFRIFKNVLLRVVCISCLISTRLSHTF